MDLDNDGQYDEYPNPPDGKQLRNISIVFFVIITNGNFSPLARLHVPFYSALTLETGKTTFAFILS